MEFVQLSICMYIVLYCENVMSLRLFERVCWLSYFEKCKLYIEVLGYVLYAVVMLPKFYKITSLEKKIFYTGFQQATRLCFIGFSSHWK